MESLNIPLSKKNQTWENRVLQGAFCIILLIACWISVRAFFVTDSTSWLAPEQTAYSIHLPILPRTASQLSQHIGSKALFSHNVWTINHLFEWCGRSCSIHMDEQSSIIGLSTKNQPTDQQIAQWEATGLSVYNQNETILISANAPSDDLAPKTTFRLGLLLPFNDASILFRESGTRTSIRITNRGITILGQTGIQQQNPSIFAPEVRILSQLSISAPETLSFDGQSIATSPVLQDFLASLTDQPVSLALGRLNGEIVYSLQLSDSLNQQEAAQLSRELVKADYLSTLEWTIDSSTTVEELRFSDDLLEIDTRTSPEGYYMEVRAQDQTALRLTQTNEVFSLSNAEISLEENESSEPVCLRSSRAFIRPQELIGLLEQKEHVMISDGISWLSTFSEIGFADSKTMLCW